MKQKKLSLRSLPDGTYWFHKVIAFQHHVIRTQQEMSYIFLQTGNADQTPVFFDMPRNTTVLQKRSSAVLFRTLGLYYNTEMLHFRFMNRIPILRPNLKVTSKSSLPKFLA
jgi:hypothetical protein